MRIGRSQFAVALVWLVLLAGATGQLWAQAPLTITTASLPSIAVGSNVQVKIVVSGGALPLTWKVSGGKLPPGLKLSATKGNISGIPTTPGAYQFTVTVSDSSIPAMQIQRDYTLVVTGALSIEWKQAPAVQGQALGGSVVVANSSNQDVTLTVIVMAVNEIGRATALGYQEFTLRSGAQQVIPFGSEPGPGAYIVHADAVAEVLKTNSIYRARKQTIEPLVIESPE
ncbi:MAG TPA: Ig domain-containing protein [Candidatus Angelobacter sp.]|nr:Ig domain-containing protein [Candidatus Angelobacter sp.]